MGDLATTKPSFFACYLLCSLNPRFKGRTYIGFTVNPKRRIRQHNGEITSGARKTQKMRPWEMILCVYGFPSHVHALQFEWAWQHPLKSIAVRDAAKVLKRRGARGQVLLLFTMLNLPEWNSMNLVVNILSTKHQPLTKGCPSLPLHILIKVGPLDDLPCYNFPHSESYSSADECEFEDAEESDGDSTEDSRVVKALPFKLTEECSKKMNSSFSFTPLSPSFSFTEDSDLLHQAQGMDGAMQHKVLQGAISQLSPSPLANGSDDGVENVGIIEALPFKLRKESDGNCMEDSNLLHQAHGTMQHKGLQGDISQFSPLWSPSPLPANGGEDGVENIRIVEALPFKLTEECGKKMNSSFNFTPLSPSFSFTPLSPLWSCSPILNASGASVKLGYSQAISEGGLSTKLFHDAPVSSQWNQSSPCSNVVSIQGGSHCNPISCSVTPVKRQQLEVIDLIDSPAAPEASSIKKFIIV